MNASLADLNVQSKLTGSQQLTTQMQGGRTYVGFSEQFQTLKFQELDTQLSKSSKAAADSPDNKTHIVANHDYAIRRDARYAYENPIMLRLYGVQRSFRVLYDSGKIGVALGI